MRSVQLKLRLRLGEKLTRSDGCFYIKGQAGQTMSLPTEKRDGYRRFQVGRTFVNPPVTPPRRIAVGQQGRQVLKRSRIFAEIEK